MGMPSEATAEQLRLLANEARNFAGHARRFHRQQYELGLSGINMMLAVEHLEAEATVLEERADHIEWSQSPERSTH
jgi:hypothetical protein